MKLTMPLSFYQEVGQEIEGKIYLSISSNKNKLG